MNETSRFLSIGDLGNMPKPTWLVEGMFEQNTLVMVAGPPASYKSFLVLDWIMCLASGKSWNGKEVVASKVLYVLGEGRSSLLKRINAWLMYNRLDGKQKEALDLNFRVTFEVPQMAQKSSVDNLLFDLENEEFRPDVIAIDTFARSFVGMDENSQQDTGMWVASADRLRELGYTVIFLHHTAKNTEFGYKFRGSSAIMGAMDTAFLMHKDSESGGVKVWVDKQKDHDEGEPMFFNKLIVGLGDEGSVVLVPFQKVDERFSQQGRDMQIYLNQLLNDQTFESDRARGRALAEKFGLNEEAAHKRVVRHRGTQSWDMSQLTNSQTHIAREGEI